MAKAGRRSIALSWTEGTPSNGSRVYYDQSGKLQLIADVASGTTSYKDSRLSRGTQYCYVVSDWVDCDGNGAFESAIDRESAVSNKACASAQ